MRNLEHLEQCALIEWARGNENRYPPLAWMFAVPNGGYRAYRTAVMLKAEGVKPGVFDLCLPFAAHGYHGFFIEMKRPGALNEVKPHQKEFAAYLDSAGYLAQVYDHWENATEALIWYLS